MQLSKNTKLTSIKDKFSDEDRSSLSSKADEMIAWLDDNTDASADEINGKYKELESLFNPIMQQVYQGAGGMPDMGGMAGGMPDMGEVPNNEGPNIEEVD